MFGNLKWLIFAGVLWFITVLFGTGCTMNAMPLEFGQTFKAVAVSTTDQALWDKITANIDADVINPGVRTWAAVVYEAGAQLIGTEGGVTVAGIGEGTGLQTAEAQALIRNILADRQAFDAAAAAVAEYLTRIPEPEPAPEPTEPVPAPIE